MRNTSHVFGGPAYNPPVRCCFRCCVLCVPFYFNGGTHNLARTVGCPTCPSLHRLLPPSLLPLPQPQPPQHLLPPPRWRPSGTRGHRLRGARYPSAMAAPAPVTPAAGLLAAAAPQLFERYHTVVELCPDSPDPDATHVGWAVPRVDSPMVVLFHCQEVTLVIDARIRQPAHPQ